MKELMLHCDLRAGERFFYFTTCGWMMWNWLASGLGVASTLVLYEGNPGHPDLHHLWQLAARERIAVFGTSPRFIAATAMPARVCVCSTQVTSLRARWTAPWIT